MLMDRKQPGTPLIGGRTSNHWKHQSRSGILNILAPFTGPWEHQGRSGQNAVDIVAEESDKTFLARCTTGVPFLSHHAGRQIVYHRKFDRTDPQGTKADCCISLRHVGQWSSRRESCEDSRVQIKAASHGQTQGVVVG